MRSLCALCVSVLIASAAHADIVYTTDGRQIEGEVEEQPGQYVVTTRYGKVTIPASQVARVVKQESSLKIYQDKLESLKLDPDKWKSAGEHYQLGLWCEQNRLRKEARERFEEAIILNPDHVDAHKALGHVQYLGKWVPLEDKMAAEGKVLVDGRWVSKDEAGTDGTSGAAKTGGSGVAKPSGNPVTAVTGEAFTGESKWEKCSKCGGSGILITRDCMQCQGKGYNYFGAGLGLCLVCRGTGKWPLQCPYCGGTGKTTRSRWADPVFPQVKLPNDGWQHCPKCSGTGVLTSITCAQCDGKGYIDLKESLMLCVRCGGYGKIPQRCFFCDGKGMFRK